ncbi:uncharacterized protein LOC131208812 [Anopheles bellator]|uniref:uncharacterized protein LOC131208812 n=1 Tax=Anopheles bellator TaxID=139047 RepID=UPI002647D8F0|nr:uncharacterized protein LOC131208812 [Anopheles bellator]
MATTPVRQNTSNSKIKSPRTPGFTGTVASSRVENIIYSCIEQHRKWKSAVDKGSQFCNAISNAKLSTLQSEGQLPYPENVILYCKNMRILITIFEDALLNAETCLTHIKSLESSFEASAVIGQTWNFQKIVSVLETIVTSYKNEFCTRSHISENIGHTMSTEQLKLYVRGWNSMMDLERDRELQFHMMMYEFRFSG